MTKKATFLFDLDSIIIDVDVLKNIAKISGKENEMDRLINDMEDGTENFRESFLLMTEVLKKSSVDKIAKVISEISLPDKIMNFINKNKDNCYIVTTNLDVWVIELMKKIGMENNFYSSVAYVEDDCIKKIVNIISKEEVLDNFEGRIVAIGDSSNDRAMLTKADISIGYGGIKDIDPFLIEVIDYAICNEGKLCEFLEKLV